METIKSFTVDHKRLLPGVYVSRKDSTGHDVVTTFDTVSYTHLTLPTNSRV